MNSETRVCQNCKNDFTIEPDDFAFYEKIQVPPPTFCPECRMIRRMVWRNHRSFYRRSCEVCKKSLISVYKEDNAPVMCTDCWNGDAWNIFALARDIDWSTPLLSQIEAIFKEQPRVFQYRLGGTNVNSDYANSISNCKNAYLSFSLLSSEDIFYSENIDNSKEIIDSFNVSNADKCLWNIDSSENYNCHFVIESHKNIDSSFLYDCQNCQNCCLSASLRNKSYYFKNTQVTKEEYEELVAKLHLETYTGVEKTKDEFVKIREAAPRRYAQVLKSVDAGGDHIKNSKNIRGSHNITGSEDVTNSFRIVTSRDIHDCTWVLDGELEYETISGSAGSNNHIGCAVCFTSSNMEYSLFCKGCSDCFLCVGLKNAKYCILNKQYSKEDYMELVPRLREHMRAMPFVDEKGRTYVYGDFYPSSFSPFGYNETLAHDNFPKTESEAKNLGLNWKEKEVKDHAPTKEADDLPDSILDTDDSILDEIIACQNKGDQMTQCTTAFKIVPGEFDVYKNKKLPLPHFCPNCRHYQRLSLCNPLKLWHRQCMCDQDSHDHEGKCANEFETSYAPDRPEKVYCESCYQKEVL
jgi:hypothetical protein